MYQMFCDCVSTLYYAVQIKIDRDISNSESCLHLLAKGKIWPLVPLTFKILLQSKNARRIVKIL